jgi:uncharacterized protein (DUF58 family)
MQSQRTSPRESRAYLSAVIGGQNRYTLGRVRLDANSTDETLQARRPLYLVGALLLLISLFIQQALVFVAGLLLLALAVAPELWYRYALRQLVAYPALSTERAEIGDTVQVSVVIENRKALMLPYLEVETQFPDALPLMGHILDAAPVSERALLRNIYSLWAYQRVARHYRARALTRGVYAFGPMRLRVSDPFGLLEREHIHEATATLIVHPLIAPLERLGLSARAPFGEQAAPRRLLEDPLRIAGVRAYQPGDGQRRIHWKATARLGALQSKILETSTRHTLLIFLDIRTFAQVSKGYAPDLVELAITAAASVASWALDQGYAVGLVSNGSLVAPELDVLASTGPAVSDDENEDTRTRIARAVARAGVAQRLRIAPSPRKEQLPRLLDGLARLLPYYGGPMQPLLAAEESSLPAGATVLYVGAETLVEVPTIIALRRFKSMRHAVSLLLTTPDHGEGAEEGPELYLADLDVRRIGGGAEWRALRADALDPGPLRRASSVPDYSMTPEERSAFLQGIHSESPRTAATSKIGEKERAADDDSQPSDARQGEMVSRRPLTLR